jgi:hypothetical protein
MIARLKPKEVPCVRFMMDNEHEVRDFCAGRSVDVDKDGNTMVVETMTGTQRIHPGYYVLDDNGVNVNVMSHPKFVEQYDLLDDYSLETPMADFVVPPVVVDLDAEHDA